MASKITMVINDLSKIKLSELIAAASEFHIEEVGGARGATVYASVMRHFTPSGIFTVASVLEWLDQDGHGTEGANAMLLRLVAGGYIAEHSEGAWQYLRPFSVGQSAP